MNKKLSELELDILIENMYNRIKQFHRSHVGKYWMVWPPEFAFTADFIDIVWWLMPKVLADIPVMRMLESWEMGFKDMIVDDDGRILNLIPPSEFGKEWFMRRMPGVTERDGVYYYHTVTDAK